MKGYKGFEKGLVCRGKQYAENTVFKEKEARLCSKGMHFCELPHNVFRYYAPGCGNEFCEVEANKAITDDGEKFCTKELKIGKKISVFDICNISIAAMRNKYNVLKCIEFSPFSAGSENVVIGTSYSAIRTGIQNAIQINAQNAILMCENSVIQAGASNAINALSFSAIKTDGYNAIRAKSSSAIEAACNSAIAASCKNAILTKCESAIVSYDENSICAGSFCAIVAENKNRIDVASLSVVLAFSENTISVGDRSVAVAIGKGSKLKGRYMSLLIFALLDEDNCITGYSCNVVDGKKIKEDIYYMLDENNELIEVEE